MENKKNVGSMGFMVSPDHLVPKVTKHPDGSVTINMVPYGYTRDMRYGPDDDGSEEYLIRRRAEGKSMEHEITPAQEKRHQTNVAYLADYDHKMATNPNALSEADHILVVGIRNAVEAVNETKEEKNKKP